MSVFFAKLNEVAKAEEIPLFKSHTPKSREASAYGYQYTPDKVLADRIAVWLRGKRIDSEILFVKNNEHYMVRIPFINTFAADHFEKKKKPVELEKVKVMISETAKLDPLWANTCSKVAKCIEELWSCHEDYHAIRAQDLIQTTLFEGDDNLSNDPVVQAYASRVSIDWQQIKGSLSQWLKNVRMIDSECESLREAAMRVGATGQHGVMSLRMSLMNINMKIEEIITRFCKLTTSDILTRTEIFKLDNLIYKQWLVLKKQMQTIEGDPRYTDLWNRCLELNNKMIAIARNSKAKLGSLHFGFFRPETQYFFIRFLDYHITPSDKRKNLDPERILAEKIVVDNLQAIADVQKSQEDSNKEIVELAHEIFKATNPPKPQACEEAI